MPIDEAIDKNVELKGELVKKGRLEKAKAVQLGIEALKVVADSRVGDFNEKLLPGETKE